jgi:phosphate ABC transporter phosphate-binding protein
VNKVIQVGWSLGLWLLAACAGWNSGYAAVSQSSHVRKLFIDSLGNEHGAVRMHDLLVHRLQISPDLQIVSDPEQADITIKGEGRMWVTGRTSVNPRSHIQSQPTFGGFLSVEVVSKNGNALWSYLVTPSKFVWKSIPDDLANQMAGKLLPVLKGEGLEGATSTAISSKIQATLRGAGATFPAPLYQQWFELFQEQHPNVRISYDAIGSAEGIQQLKDGKADFGASEMPLSDDAMSAAHQHFTQLPAVLGAVVVIYNIKGLPQTLNFTPETLSGIFLGKIKKWSDPQIRESNRGASLPDAKINVVHRSDGSGTTFVLSDYLSKASPEWKNSVGTGTALSWPSGVGADRSDGVASAVQQTPNSIGYVEFIYAIHNQLSFGAIQNATGQFVKANISSVTAAAAAATNSASKDFRVSIANAPGKDSYPIATYTWLLFPKDIADKNKQEVMKDLLRWVLTSGQRTCSALGYAPLPTDIAKRALESFDSAR